MIGSKIKNVTENISEELFARAEFDSTAGEKNAYSNYSYWRSTISAFTKNKIAMLFMVMLCVLVLFTMVQPYLPHQKDATTIYINAETGRQDSNRKPDSEYWFGTNSIGQDLWARVWSGTRTSLKIGIIVAAFNTVIGVAVGAVWGYVRKLDRIVTEIYNVLNNIPSTIILILATYILRPSPTTMIAAMCVTGWLPICRFVRNQIVIIRDREYNLASRCLGTSTIRIITKNLLPYLVSVIMLRIALAIPAAIGQEVFLTYIGLGLPISIPSLGNLVNEGRILMTNKTQRYQLIFPALVISLITTAFYVMGNAFADAADPKNHV